MQGYGRYCPNNPGPRLQRLFALMSGGKGTSTYNSSKTQLRCVSMVFKNLDWYFLALKRRLQWVVQYLERRFQLTSDNQGNVARL